MGIAVKLLFLSTQQDGQVYCNFWHCIKKQY